MELVKRFFWLFMCLTAPVLFCCSFPFLENVAKNGIFFLRGPAPLAESYAWLLALYLFFVKLFHKIKKTEFYQSRFPLGLIEIVASTGISAAIIGIIVTALLLIQSI